MADIAVPASLKAIKPYLTHAKQVEKVDPLMAYYCRRFAVEYGVELRQKAPDEESKLCLLGLLDKLEVEKQQLASLIQSSDGYAHVEAFSLQIFNQADQQDRAGNITKVTARSFYAASIFLNILRQFDPEKNLSPEIEEKLKYAKWKAADITTALKEGRTPIPGPARSLDDDGSGAIDGDLGAIDGASHAMGGAAPGAPYQQQQQQPPLSNFQPIEPQPSVPMQRAVSGAIPSSDFSALGFGASPATQPAAMPPPAAAAGAGGFDFQLPQPPSTKPAQQLPPQQQQQPPPSVQQQQPPPNVYQQQPPAAHMPPVGSTSFHGAMPGAYGGPAAAPPVDHAAADALRREQDLLRRQQEEFLRQKEALEREQRIFQQQRQQQQQQQQQRSAAGAAGSASSSWGREYDSSGVSPQRMDEAQKHAKFAVSALQFEDVPTAVKELRLALQLLESK